MENLRTIKSVFSLLGEMLLILLAIPFFVFAYSDETTHPALTDEIVDHFNRYYPAQELSVSQKELVKQGSINEDTGTRWLQHFYDPIKNRGLVLGNDTLLRNPELAAIIGASRSEWQSSKEWAHNTSAQAGLLGNSAYGSIFPLFSSRSDFSWERAVYEYAWGDKNRAMLALGHILHLIEDASVPDHTRNDPHPHVTEWVSTLNESPYEIWTKKFTPNKFAAYMNESPLIFGSLNEYFDSMARYSNGNFFSKDTILNGYVRPEIQKEVVVVINNKSYRFGIALDESGGIYKLAKVDKIFGEKELIYSLVSPNDVVLTDYWSHLSRQAILHGAGVMKLFFDEVAREQQTKTLYNKNRSWLRKIGDGIAGMLQNVAGSTTRSSVGLLATVNPAILDNPESGNLSVSIGRPINTNAESENSPSVGEKTLDDAVAQAETEIPIEIVALSLASAKPVPMPAPPSQNSPLVFSPGGAGPRREIDNQQLIPHKFPDGNSTGQATNNEPAAPADATPPDAPVVTAPAGTIQTTSRIAFSGTAEINGEISQDFDAATTTANESGAWLLALDLPQGTTTINFFAKDSAGNTSIGAAKIIFVDSDAPGIALSIDECTLSLSQDGCLIATTTLTLWWSSSASDIATYFVTCEQQSAPCANFSYDPNATNAIFLAENNHVYIFTARARDINGNESSRQRTVEVRTTPVIINEIAWAGTASSSEDEWIELKNLSSLSVALSGWRLYSETDGTPDIALSGTVPAGGYFLLERKDDATVSDIIAGQLYGNDGSDWALNNTGETLALAYGAVVADKTPPANSCSRRWCWGDATNRQSMERIDPLLAGTSAVNWATHNGIVKNGTDAAGNLISGTPKTRNSANYDLAHVWRAHGEPQLLTLSQAVYVIDSSGFTVPTGKTLKFAPGAVVKFVDAQHPSLLVNGTLKAEGTAADPVVFTSIYDDAYGGDTNGDGICNPANASSTALCPNPGSWKQIYIGPTSENTILNYAIIRYGGRWFNIPEAFRAMLAVDDADMRLSNSTLEYSWGHGLRLLNSNSVIENNVFLRNAEHDNDTGFYIGGGNPIIRGNTSSYNAIGGLISNIGGVFSDNAFTHNTNEALLVSGSIPVIINATASANGTNGIFLQSIPSEFSFLRGLPYITEDQPILSSGSYAFEAGAVVKFKSLSSGLTFDVPVNIIGSGAEPIVFTAYADDAYGGDTNNNGACAPEDASSTAACPAPGAWRGLKFTVGADTSTLDNVIVRYAGSHSEWAGIKTEDASIVIQNSVVEQNSRKGIWLQNSEFSEITDTVIRNHTKPDADSDVSGLYLSGSHADIGGLTFINNTVGINAPDAATGGSSITIIGPINIGTSNAIPTIPQGLMP